MDIEFLGGSCPHCKNYVYGKLVPNSLGAFQFDACPSCGFIEFETDEKRGVNSVSYADRVDMWITLLERNGSKTLAEMKVNLDKHGIDENVETVFNYCKSTPEYIMSCVVSQADISKAFALNGSD